MYCGTVCTIGTEAATGVFGVVGICATACTAGIAVAAPDSKEAFFVRVRPVVRFRDVSTIRIQPTTIDRQRDREITLIIQPTIVRLSAPSEELLVRAEVQTDGRLTTVGTNNQQGTFSRNSVATSELRLKYNLDLSSNNLHPVHLNIALKYSLPACTDSYTRPCPVFNNIPGRWGVVGSLLNTE